MIPIFLFSLPRSGSTLLQRILGGHSEIATVSEPWILLPQLYALRSEGVYAEYGHLSAANALHAFSDSLEGGREAYLAALREFVLRTYRSSAGRDARYFLDKTPRYHLVGREIIELFPDGRFLFLWRNPLSIVASMIDTWGNGRWNIYRHKVDLFDGVDRLLETFQEHADKAYVVHYEQLVARPAEVMREVSRYLGLQFEESTIHDLSHVRLEGRLGDRSQENEIATAPVEKWRTMVRNPARKAWCRRYLEWIGRERLSLMGYQLDELRTELAAVPSSMRRLGSDGLWMTYGFLYSVAEPVIWKHKIRLLPKLRYMHAHT
jgi:hypothetical protein